MYLFQLIYLSLFNSNVKVLEGGQKNDWALETSLSSFDCDLPRRSSVAFMLS